MPGSSLWLIPNLSSAFSQTLQEIITNTVPSHFPSYTTHAFIPHVTLTSNIPSTQHTPDPQQWLNGLNVTDQPIRATIEKLEPGVPFFKKLTLRLEKQAALLDLAAECRAAGVLEGDGEAAGRWAQDEYLPHASLMYAEIDVSEVKANCAAIGKDLDAAKQKLAKSSEDGVVERGALIVLVPTDRPINEWQPIAERPIKTVEWIWQ